MTTTSQGTGRPDAQQAPPDAASQVLTRLHAQVAAAQAGDLARFTAEADAAAALLPQVAGDAELLHRLRDLQAYCQLLLRYAFTSWASERVADKGYDARGLAAPLPRRPASLGVV